MHCMNRTCPHNLRAHCQTQKCDRYVKPRRHFGSVFNPRTQEFSLDSILRRNPGNWVSVYSLCTLIPSAAPHSVVSNLRLQLNPGESIENKLVWRPAVGRKESYYRLVVRETI